MPTNRKRADAVRAESESNKPVPPKGVPILIPADMIERIDAVKDPMIPRSRYVRKMLDDQLRILEHSAENAER